MRQSLESLNNELDVQFLQDSMAATLTDRATIQREIKTDNLQGGHFSTWNNIYINIPCGVELQDGRELRRYILERKEVASKETVSREYTFYFGIARDIRDGDRIIYMGHTLSITGTVRPITNEPLREVKAEWLE